MNRQTAIREAGWRPATIISHSHLKSYAREFWPIGAKILAQPYRCEGIISRRPFKFGMVDMVLVKDGPMDCESILSPKNVQFDGKEQA